MVQEYWNIPHGLQVAFYALAIITVCVFGIGLWRRLRLWGMGADIDEELQDKGPLGLLLLSCGKLFSSDSLFAKRVFRVSGFRGVMLSCVVLSFFVLLLGTIGRGIDYWITGFLSGRVWLIFSLVLDIGGGLLLVGTGFYLVRKYTAKSDKSFSKPRDCGLLVVLFMILLSGFCVEGLRLAATNPDAADWSPIGWVFALLFKGAFTGAPLMALHRGVWVIHFLLAFWFIAMIPYSKYMHMFAAQITMYLSRRRTGPREFSANWVRRERVLLESKTGQATQVKAADIRRHSQG